MFGSVNFRGFSLSPEYQTMGLFLCWVVNDNGGGRSSKHLPSLQCKCNIYDYVLIWILEVLLRISHSGQWV
ncbi:hypothetical protein Csa_018459 [Cucumis sativus]|uniref:Uncharacterized protein n=1 Tax=Cucumis sativus TaxID=3659 RepID=A0A0A0KLH1_CUCSA|nr:hypothetical protein Csa_018459 [Cucumis sativus]